MNLLMQGTKFELAERYTAAAKLLFLTFWYSSIFPGAFFWCAFAMQVIYYLDKLSLTRTWKRVPRLGSTISQFNRRYFLPLSIVGESDNFLLASAHRDFFLTDASLLQPWRYSRPITGQVFHSTTFVPMNP